MMLEEISSILEKLEITTDLMSLPQIDAINNLIEETEHPQITNYVITDILEDYGKSIYRRQNPWKLKTNLDNHTNFALHVSRLENNIKAVVLLAHKSVIESDGAIRFVMPVKVTDSSIKVSDDMNWAANEQNEWIAKQPILDTDKPFATGIYIDGSTILTCAHFINTLNEKKLPITDYLAIQGYYFMDDKENSITRDQIKFTEIKKVSVEPQYSINSNKDIQDIALLETVGKFTGNNFPIISDEGINCGEDVYCLGFGWGQPMKISLNGYAYYNQKYSMRSKLITRPGNSGSPIFNGITHEIVGVHYGNNPEIEALEVRGRLIPFTNLTGKEGTIFTKINKKSEIFYPK